MCRGSDPLRIERGLLQVPAVETCRLRWRVSALARDFTHLAIRLAKTPRGSASSEFRVSWRHSAEDDFDPDRDAVAPYGTQGWIIVPFGGPHWNGPLYELLLNPGQVDGIQIESIRGFHVADLLEPAGVGPAGFDRAHVELLRQCVDSRVEIAGRVDDVIELWPHCPGPMISVGTPCVSAFTVHTRVPALLPDRVSVMSKPASSSRARAASASSVP